VKASEDYKEFSLFLRLRFSLLWFHSSSSLFPLFTTIFFPLRSLFGNEKSFLNWRATSDPLIFKDYLGTQEMCYASNHALL
jgi:hypothetical protein